MTYFYNLLNNYPISIRLYIGFGILLIMFLITGAIWAIGFKNISDNFHQVREASQEAALIAKIDRNTIDLSRNVQVFIHSGHEVRKARVNEISQKLNYKIEKVRTSTKQPSTRNHLTRMQEHLQSHMDNFSTVAEERDLYNNLTQYTMSNLSQKIEADLEEVIETHSDANKEIFRHVKGAISHFLKAERFAARFFLSLDSSLVKQTKEQINMTRSELGLLSETAEISKTLEDLEEFETSFLRAVQAARAYLYQVNVVMAGQANEFKYHANQMRGSIYKLQTEMKDKTSQEAAKQIQANAFVFITSIIVCVIISILIAKSVTEPITDMTKTFTQLSLGDQEAVIPGLDHKDEIGEMAKAANIFKNKNRQTEKLLEESRKLTGELDRKGKELQNANSELEQFIYTVSHDLKSPIVTSMGFIGIIRDMMSKGNYDLAKSQLSRLEQANNRMSKLISDLLDLSRVGRVEDDKTQIKMQELLATLEEQLTPKLEESNISLTIEPNIPSIYANEGSVTQVFDNLITNAIKYSRTDTKQFIKVYAKEKEDEIIYTVEDNGPGIPAEYQKKIFELFQRLDTQKEGTGIGLSIVSKIMESMNGSIHVESEVNKGSRFIVNFPKLNGEIANGH
ncbi:MAG: HAMP domain-containing sensor histidine kinase [Verrucomicrobiota bacterium]